MPATAKAKRQASVAKPAKGKQAKATAAAIAPKPKRARKQEPTAEQVAAATQQARSESISAAMLENSEARKEARAKRKGIPAKYIVFDLWFAALMSGKAFDLDGCAKKFAGEIKETTIKSWRNGFRRGWLPANGKGKEKAIAAAIKKGSQA